MNAVTEAQAGQAHPAGPRRLRITEIFLSLQGESHTVGLPTVFVRLTGCPLRCTYCDTAYAFHGGEWMGFDDILAEIHEKGVKHVCVTGGEPLAQPECHRLLAELCDAGFSVSLETSGAMAVDAVDARVMKVLDLKTPASGEVSRNRWENLEFLDRKDQVKIVICNRDDYEWAVKELRERRLDSYCDVLFSPSWGEQDARELADWIVEDRLPVRFQVQLHKILWGDEKGR
ncbi:MAG: 7-carboxy-7-deazaguanine synthase QueE [Gammaproteobacteria bacterium]|nr:7-carboxy-7-deazaguanine synthase QueE [Gammaproteobacteria bacterium]